MNFVDNASEFLEYPTGSRSVAFSWRKMEHEKAELSQSKMLQSALISAERDDCEFENKL